MTASNHFATGALIGASIASPWLAIPLAVSSHFVLDALPHFGYEGKHENKRLEKPFFRYVLEIDIIIFFVMSLGLAFWLDRPELVLFGFLGYSPDLMWVYQFIFVDKFRQLRSIHTKSIMKFHAGIQKFESQQGIIVEIFVFVLLVSLLWQKIG